MDQQPASKSSAETRQKDSPPRLQSSQTCDTEAPTLSATSSASQHHSPADEEGEVSAPLYPKNFQQVAIKLLLTHAASGSIIGRSGNTISELQTRSKARIKLSQSGEYFPGTTSPNRVCLIQGTLVNTKHAVELILSKLFELQSHAQVQAKKTARPDDSGSNVDIAETNELPQSFLVRLLVPTSSCGMLIGRFGSNIKQLKDESGVSYIQLSQKENDGNAHDGISSPISERIMTITGPNCQSCVQCVHFILDDMAANTELFRYTNMTTHYSKPTPTSQVLFSCEETYSAPPQAFDFPLSLSGNQMLVPAPAFCVPSSVGPQLDYPASLETNIPLAYRSVLQPHGYNMTPPIQYAEVPAEFASLSISSPPIPTLHTQVPPVNVPQGGFTSQFDSLHGPFQLQNPHICPPQQSQPSAIPQNVTCEMGIPERMVGSIMGRGGKILTEIQSQSMTKIHLSERGEYLPGTDQRVATITGSSPESVATAQYLIRQRLSTNR